MSEVNQKFIYGNRYELGDLVGKGSYSWVVKAFDIKLHRIVCLKIAYPLEGMSYQDRARAFRTEAEIGASLFHPNIVRILDFSFMLKDVVDNEEPNEEVHGEPIIVMDYIEGVKLWTFSQKNELSISRIVDIGIQITKALNYTHNLDIPVIHRDIREDNILINKEGYVYLTDWGVSKRGKSLVTTRVAKGTYGFMAPEVMDIQLATKLTDAFRPIDGRADLFSLGVVLYKLVCHELPFKQLDHVLRLRDEIHDQNFLSPSEINSLCPPALEHIIIKLLKENCEERYQNASELLGAIKDLVKEVGSAPIHDCENIVPDVIMKKDVSTFKSQNEPTYGHDEETYIPDAPQTFIAKINPKVQKIGAGIIGIIFIFSLYKFLSPNSSQQIAPEVDNEIVQKKSMEAFNNEKFKQVSSPEQLEKILDKKKTLNEPLNLKKYRSEQSVEKLGDSLLVYSKDNPDQQGYTTMKTYGIVVGTVFDAMIVHEIETSNIGSPVRALLTKDVLAKGKIVFPKGAKLLGSAIGDQSERIQVMFDRIILPNNQEVEFNGSALDEAGALGIKGKVNREKTKRMNSSGGRVLGSIATNALDMATGGSLAGQAVNTAGQEAVNLGQEEVDFKNQAATVIKLEKDVNIKIYVQRTF